MAAGPNSLTRKARARKAHKCQLCGTKVLPAKAKSVIVDPPGVGDVSVVKAREGKSYWCGDCAKDKAAAYETAIERKRKNGTGSKAAAKKATAKAKPAATAGGKKRTVKKGAGKKRTAKAGAKSDPF